MKTTEIKIDSFKDYKINLFNYRNFLPSNINFLHSKSIYVVTLIILALTTLVNIQAICLLIPLILLYFYQYFELNRLKHNIELTRKHPSKGKEEETIDISYQFSNPTAFTFSNFNLFDVFNGHSDNDFQNIFFFNKHEFLKNSRKSQTRKVELNEGMGDKIFGPLGLCLTDELGIHRLIYKNNLQPVIQVYPKVYPSKPHKLTADPYSSHFGEYDTTNRGENVNFFGVREYQQGDNVKKINWKLSLKNNQIIVNEFEKNVNAKILIIFNNDQRVHSGSGAQSSFEYIKDITLSICHQHTKNFNEIALISHSKRTSFKSGPSHIKGIEFLISKLELEEYSLTEHYHRGSAVPKEVVKLKKKVMMEIDSNTHLYYVSGFLPGKISHSYIEALKLWSKKAITTTFIAVSNLQQQAVEIDSESRSSAQSLLKSSNAQKDIILRDLKRTKIRTKFIEVNRNIPYIKVIQDGLRIRKNDANRI